MDSTLTSLAHWLPSQRWYAAKGQIPKLELVAVLEHDSPAHPDATVRTLLVRDHGGPAPVLYQVPVVERATAEDDDHVIGTGAAGTSLVDGVFDPAYTDVLLGLFTTGGASAADAVTGHPTASSPGVQCPLTASVLTGEQSNTSLIYRGGAGTPVICKVFRQLHPGLNPDIELQSALADAGSTDVPATIGWVDGRWEDGEAGAVTGSLAFAQEFLPGVEDAWRVALRSAADGADFRIPARELGTATSRVHRALARIFPTRAATEGDRGAAHRGWLRRLDLAIAEVPALATHRGAIEAVYARALEVPWPALQRVHGDYHLGQVLRAPARGWVLLDFEGEPLRPMSERTDLDLALRDIAGMLRSFDYVAGSLRLDSTADATDWARGARAAFLEGYRDAASADFETALLDALELDKAVYEAIYEARNRPTWLSIPLDAVARLADRPSRCSPNEGKRPRD